ncbi:hypothetical protein WN72_04270 [Bradyrhizobium arachidis]|uniref:Uncharacterized protein n=1 Tax=Bradyrhizobium arachidis TaxID=858423 RepID=A0AAE7NIN9_9BRAD|nr:hypothetical protein WN72_04270 [Bradyrhizobium arachidis]
MDAGFVSGAVADGLSATFRARASSFETALTRLLRMRLSSSGAAENAVANSDLILRSPPKRASRRMRRGGTVSHMRPRRLRNQRG